MDTINERIKKARADAGLSLREFGKGAGITASSVLKIENGENNPSEQTVRLISSAFKVNYQWLKEGVGPMYTPAESDLDLVMDVFAGENEFAKKVFKVFAQLDDSSWHLIRKIVLQLQADD